jgi:hypothetical protein
MEALSGPFESSCHIFNAPWLGSEQVDSPCRFSPADGTMLAMKEAPVMLRTIAAAIVGGLVGGLLVWTFLPAAGQGEGAIQPETRLGAEPTGPAAPEDPPPRRDERERDDDARIQRLERLVKLLQQRQAAQAQLDAKETRPRASDGPDDEGEPNRVTLNAADPRFEQAVRTIIDKAQGEQEEKHTDRREDRRDKRVTRKVDYLVDKLELSTEQQEKVDTIFFTQAEAMRALFGGDDRPVTRKQFRERMAAVREETKKRLLEVLSASQKTSYEQLEQDEGFNASWFGH